MRYKKQIIIICLFTFLFLPFQKYEETKAFDLVVTPTVITLCGALALTCGVVVANQNQFIEVGNRVFDKIKDIPGAFEKIGDKIKINALEGVLFALGEVCSSLPDSEIYSKYIYEKNLVDGGSKVSNSCFVPYTVLYKGDFYLDYSFTCSYYSPTAVKVGFSGYGSTSYKDFDFGVSKGDTFNVKVYYKYTGYDSNNYYYYLPTITVNGVSYDYPDRVFAKSTSTQTPYVNFDQKVVFDNVNFNKSVCVDMKGVKDNVSVDKPLVYFPEVGKGSISLDKEIESYPSIDAPISLPTDLPGISVDSGVSDDVIDIPGTDVGDTPVTGNSMWDTLLEWLRTLIQPIIDLLSAILGFFTNLLDKLRELLIELFVPSEGIFVDAFNGWRSDLEAKFGLDLSVIDGLQSVEEQGIKDIKFTVMGVDVVLPLSFVNKFASTSRTFTTGLVIIFLAWYQYRNAYKLIRNSSPIEGDGGGKK